MASVKPRVEGDLMGLLFSFLCFHVVCVRV